MLTACILSLLVCHVGASTIVINSVKPCDNKTGIFQLSSQGRVKNNRQEYDWTFNISDVIGNNNILKAVIARDYGNQIKHVLTYQKKGFCNGLRDFLGTIITTEVLTLMKHPHPTQCPFEKGMWRMNWHYIDLSKIPTAKFVASGKYLVTVTMESSNKQLGCLLLAVEKKM